MHFEINLPLHRPTSARSTICLNSFIPNPTVVRVRWESVYVNPGFTRRILGVLNPIPFLISCSIRSPRMSTSKCASTGSRTQLHSGIILWVSTASTQRKA
ncbi:hypothetical protein CY34DRAFT_366048 [Suillus luteus UH-Slu-Lm8-n1]|uniref:Uncharacterized protein n=1 Tax=Suillus luteus UH-Slu-Lm8-n1 TaxID=930992 RepID=A0A0D0AL92_9AGAM|nr:hypothetical protein CY34DRAFT_366048 [Suillus luteus UH-Slu-Lm8-n1]